MGRIKTSKIWVIDKEELQFLLDNSSSIAEVIEKIGLDPYNGNHKTLNQRIKEENFDLSKLENNRTIKNKQIGIKNRFPLNNILTENSNYNRSQLKKRLVEDNLLEYKCSSCGIIDVWNNKPISLQLDHINGINNDNRLKNLRFLCPNCHSQTETYCGKHRKKIYNCLDCGKEIKKDSKRCNKCSSILNNKSQRKFEISKEELIKLINQYPMTKIGKMFNVSDNAIRKRCRTLGIDLKRDRGHDPLT
jgi:Zn finger protein HypA/HybF involved in hydrogenase expression/predicted nucleic acid-binding Zn ribbon protein